MGSDRLSRLLAAVLLSSPLAAGQAGLGRPAPNTAAMPCATWVELKGHNSFSGIMLNECQPGATPPCPSCTAAAPKCQEIDGTIFLGKAETMAECQALAQGLQMRLESGQRAACQTITWVEPSFAPEWASQCQCGTAAWTWRAQEYAQDKVDSAYCIEYEARHWGWPFLAVLLACAGPYLLGGSVYNQRTKGLQGRAAIPHAEQWRELWALAEDGWRYAQRKAGGGTQDQARIAGSGGMESFGKGSGERGEGKIDGKRRSKEKRSRGSSRGEREPADGLRAPLAPEPEQSQGRWVHVGS